MSRINACESLVDAMEEILPAVPEPEMEEEQERLALHAREGTTCGICGQYVKIYPRKLNSNMVSFLISLYHGWRRTSRDWVHHSDCFHVGRDYPYVATWRLAKLKPNSEDSTKRKSGLWKPTKRGRLFIKNKRVVPSHVFMFNNKVVGWSDKNIDVLDALGNKFNYKELMRS